MLSMIFPIDWAFTVITRRSLRYTLNDFILVLCLAFLVWVEVSQWPNDLALAQQGLGRSVDGEKEGSSHE